MRFTHIGALLLLTVGSCCEVLSLQPLKVLTSTRRGSFLTMSNRPSIAVVGFSGGTAEVTAYKLSRSGFDVSLLLDDNPVSPVVRKGNSIDYTLCQDDAFLNRVQSWAKIPLIPSLIP